MTREENGPFGMNVHEHEHNEHDEHEYEYTSRTMSKNTCYVNTTARYLDNTTFNITTFTFIHPPMSCISTLHIFILEGESRRSL